MKISIASYSFHGLTGSGMMDVFGYLETCRHRYGLHAADIWNGTISDDPERYLNDDFLRKLKSALDEREMVLANYAVDSAHVWDDSAEKRKAHRDLAFRQLRAAEYLGAKTVRIDAGGGGTVWSNEQWDVIIEAFNEYAQFAANAGFRVGPESHWGPELVPDNMERLARSVDSPAFGVLLHIGHWEQAPIEEGDRRLARWAMHTHVDQKTTENRLDSALGILLDAGYTGYWGVEHHTGKFEYAEVALQLAAVRRSALKLQQGDAVTRGARSGTNHLIPSAHQINGG